jgi:hypothetical protein
MVRCEEVVWLNTAKGPKTQIDVDKRELCHLNILEASAREGLSLVLLPSVPECVEN